MALDHKKIQAICFDIDGTLSDTDDQYVSRVEKILKPMRLALSQWEVRVLARRLVMASETPANLAYAWLDELGADHLLERVMKRTAGKGYRKKKFLLVQGVREMLTTLQKKYPLAVVSARNERSSMEFLDQFGLVKFFKVIVTSQTCEHTKPYPDPLLYAATVMRVKSENCLMVGDTTVDIKTGRRAGAQNVGVLCGFGTEKELIKAGADVILPSTGDLLQLFKRV